MLSPSATDALVLDTFPSPAPAAEGRRRVAELLDLAHRVVGCVDSGPPGDAVAARISAAAAGAVSHLRAALALCAADAF
jgi:hypothetical protein